MSCRSCKDLGWIEVAKDDLRPCNHCNQVSGPTAAEVIAIGIGFCILFVMMLTWGHQ